MGSYVDSVLAADERVVYRAAISHWKFFLAYLVGGLFVFAALGSIVVTENRTDATYMVAAALLAIGLAVALSAVIRRQTTELALTDRRIIMKRGLISRDTVEMNLGKVESLHVNQGVLGRLFDFGDLTVVGTGSSLEPLYGIANPLELRRKLGEVVQTGTPKANA